MTVDFFDFVYHCPYTTVIKIGKIVLESSEVNFVSLAALVFDVDHVAKIRSGLSIIVLKKKK